MTEKNIEEIISEVLELFLKFNEEEKLLFIQKLQQFLNED